MSLAAVTGTGWRRASEPGLSSIEVGKIWKRIEGCDTYLEAVSIKNWMLAYCYLAESEGREDDAKNFGRWADRIENMAQSYLLANHDRGAE